MQLYILRKVAKIEMKVLFHVAENVTKIKRQQYVLKTSN